MGWFGSGEKKVDNSQEIEKIKDTLRQYDRILDDITYEMRYYKEDAERCKAELCRANDAEEIAFLKDSLKQSNEVYQEKKSAHEQAQRRIAELEAKLRRLDR